MIIWIISCWIFHLGHFVFFIKSQTHQITTVKIRIKSSHQEELLETKWHFHTDNIVIKLDQVQIEFINSNIFKITEFKRIMEMKWKLQEKTIFP